MTSVARAEVAAAGSPAGGSSTAAASPAAVESGVGGSSASAGSAAGAQPTAAQPAAESSDAKPAGAAEPAAAEPAAAEPVEADGADEGNEEWSEPSPLVYYPEMPALGQVGWGLGVFYDAIDPQVVYGMTTRVPQLQGDVRIGLGDGWSWLGHLNTLVVVNELTTGPAYAISSGPLALQLSLPLGAYLGFLDGFGFDATYVMAMARPALTLGFRTGDVAASLRGELILSSPEFVTVGEVSNQLDSSGPLTGYMLSLLLENRLSSGNAWYLGLAWAATRASYQMWLLFPDTQGLYSYPRISVGYEF
ncbi:MAG TPA: hypothetical protein VLC09_07900 [Polyangiaceae bacterium]|nr:hypothetical protein [Polyangiaceae bacterium]